MSPGSSLRHGDPERLGRYRIVGRLGRGGMGTVFLGEDDTGQRVAVKVIIADFAEDEHFSARFRREVTAARSVRRFCTAPVLDARLDDEPLYIVTEFVDGPTLHEAIAERGPLRGGDLEGLAVGTATALTAIHAAGIVHRDLKPSNVMLSPTGPRVIDFGIARALDSVDGPTRDGQIVGTPAYLAPELAIGGAVTPAADVFSWGCVLAYAAGGRLPFPGENLQEIVHRIRHEPPRLRGLDGELLDLVTRALRKEPTARPSARELLARLTGQDDPAQAAENMPATWVYHHDTQPHGRTPPPPRYVPRPPQHPAPRPVRRSFAPLGCSLGAAGAAAIAILIGVLMLRGSVSDGYKITIAHNAGPLTQPQASEQNSLANNLGRNFEKASRDSEYFEIKRSVYQDKTRRYAFVGGDGAELFGRAGKILDPDDFVRDFKELIPQQTGATVTAITAVPAGGPGKAVCASIRRTQSSGVRKFAICAWVTETSVGAVIPIMERPMPNTVPVDQVASMMRAMRRDLEHKT